MSDQYIYQQVQRLIDSNDVSAVKRNKDHVIALLSSNNGQGNAINMGIAAINTSVVYRDKESKMLQWFFDEFPTIFTSKEVGYRVMEFAWDIGSLSSVAICLKHKVCHQMVSESRWMQESQLSKILETLTFEEYSLLVNLVHTTFPIIPPIMSAFSSNTHMNQLKTQAKNNPTNLFYGVEDDILALADTEKEKQFVHKIYENLLFLLSFMYTEVVVFDVNNPNWIAWKSILQFSSIILKEIGDNNEWKRLASSVVDIMVEKYCLLTVRTRELMRSHCAHVLALQNNPDLALKSQTKVLPLTFEDVHRCTSSFEDLLRCLRYLLTMSFHQQTDEHLLHHLIYLPLHPPTEENEEEENEVCPEEESESESEEEASKSESPESTEDNEEEELIRDTSGLRTRDMVSMAFEAERDQVANKYLYTNSLLQQKPYISIIGLRLATMLMQLRQEATLLVNKNTTEEFVLQQTALSISNVLKEDTLVIYGYLLAEFKFDPELVEKGNPDDRIAKCNAHFLNFSYLLKIFKLASELTLSSYRSVETTSLEHKLYFWLAKLEASGFQKFVQSSRAEWTEFLLLLEVLSESTLQLQRETIGDKVRSIYPVLLTRWMYFLHLGLHEGLLVADREHARSELRKVFLQHVNYHVHLQHEALLAQGSAAQDAYACEFRQLVFLTDVLFMPLLNREKDLLITKPLVDASKGELMTMENMHRRIRVLFLEPSFETLRKTKETRWVHPFLRVDWIHEWMCDSRAPILQWLEETSTDKEHMWWACATNLETRRAVIKYTIHLSALADAEPTDEIGRFRNGFFRAVVDEENMELTAEVIADILSCLQKMRSAADVIVMLHKLLVFSEDVKPWLAKCVSKTIVVGQRRIHQEASVEEESFLNTFTYYLYFLRSAFHREEMQEGRRSNRVLKVLHGSEEEEIRPDSFGVKALSDYLAESGSNSLNWAKALEEANDLDCETQNWFDVHPYVLRNFWSGEMFLDLSVFCSFLDSLHSIMMNGLSPQLSSSEEARPVDRVANVDHPWRFTEMPSVHFWFEVLCKARLMEKKHFDSIQIRSRLPCLNAHFCNALSAQKAVSPYAFLESGNPQASFFWFRLALLPSTAEFAKTCFSIQEDSEDSVIDFFNQQVQRSANLSRKALVSCLRGTLYVLLRVFTAHKYEYSQENTDRALFAVRLVKNLLSVLKPCYDNILDRIALVRLLFLPTEKTFEEEHVDELFHQRYGISLRGLEFADWLFSPMLQESSQTYDFAWTNAQDFNILAVRWMVLRMLSPVSKDHIRLDKRWQSYVLEPYIRFAETAPYNPDQASLVCRWLHDYHWSVTVASSEWEREVHLFYFWARDMLRSPCELKESPRSLCEKRRSRDMYYSNQYDEVDWTQVREHLVKSMVRSEEHYKLSSFEEVFQTRLFMRMEPSQWEQQEDELALEVQRFFEKLAVEKQSLSSSSLLNEAKEAAVRKWKSKHRKLVFKFCW